MSYLRYMTLYSFRKFNPDWKIEVFYPGTPPVQSTWKSKDHSVPYIGGETFWGNLGALGISTTSLKTLPVQFPEGMPDVMKSDFLRLYLLSERGGAWSDMDILFFRPMSVPFPPSNAAAYFCKHRLENPNGTPSSNPAGYHRIGLLMGSPGNRPFTTLYQKAMESWNPEVYQSLGSLLYKHLVRMDSPEVQNIPMSVVYPSSQVDIMFGLPARVLEYRITKQTIGWHWFGGNATAGEYQNRLTSQVCRETKVQKFDSIIMKLIRRIQDA